MIFTPRQKAVSRLPQQSYAFLIGMLKRTQRFHTTLILVRPFLRPDTLLLVMELLTYAVVKDTISAIVALDDCHPVGCGLKYSTFLPNETVTEENQREPPVT